MARAQWTNIRIDWLCIWRYHEVPFASDPKVPLASIPFAVDHCVAAALVVSG